MNLSVRLRVGTVLSAVGLVAALAATATPAQANAGSIVQNDKSGLCLEGASGRVAQIEPCNSGSYGGANETWHFSAGDIENGFNQCLSSVAYTDTPTVGTCTGGDAVWAEACHSGGDSNTVCYITNTVTGDVLGTKAGGTAAGTDTVMWTELSGHLDQEWNQLIPAS
jgi:hypothetical protein